MTAKMRKDTVGKPGSPPFGKPWHKLDYNQDTGAKHRPPAVIPDPPGPITGPGATTQ